jgi:predicted nucleotidyltransferase
VDDADLEVFQTKKVLLRQYILQTDIHPFVKGVTFDEAWSERTRTSIEGVRVNVPSLRHLIVMKKAAGRGKDREDLRVLRELQRLKRQLKNNGE